MCFWPFGKKSASQLGKKVKMHAEIADVRRHQAIEEMRKAQRTRGEAIKTAQIEATRKRKRALEAAKIAARKTAASKSRRK